MKQNKFNPFKNNENQAEDTQKSGKSILKVVILAILLVIVIWGGATSTYSLNQDEQAVVTIFGKPSVVTEAGLKFKIPFGIQKVNKFSKSIQEMTIGYVKGTNEPVESESMMITKDFNFVNVDFTIEYTIADPLKALANCESYEAIIKNMAQSYIRDTVGLYDVDSVITDGKPAIQAEVKEKLTTRIEAEDIGIYINDVKIQDSELPTQEVKNAFNRVEDAKQNMESSINEAKKYQSEKIPAAQAKADQIIKDAEAQKIERVNEASGQVARFNKMYEEYVNYPLITKKRMFYETMEELLVDLKVIIDNGNGTTKFLPLEPFNTVENNNSEQ